MTEIYFDNSATTPLCAQAAEKMTRVMAETYGNPSSLHKMGLLAEKTVDGARDAVLRALCPPKTGLRPKREQLIFTASGTEANNLAMIGIMTAKARNKGKKIIVGETEHPSVIETAKHLEALGYTAVYIPSPNGVWDMDAYRKALDKDTVLVCAMLVNNETGAMNDIAAIAKAAKAVSPEILVHCDAVQGFLKTMQSPLPHADSVSISAHKIGGPKGVGALFVSEKILKTKALTPVIFGGGQENGFRSGTENVIGIAGFGAAAEFGASRLSSSLTLFSELRAYFTEKITEMGDAVRINEPLSAKKAAHIISLTVPGYRSETLLHSLSAYGVYVSSGSACASNTGHSSYVLRSFGLSDTETDSTLRISLGPQNTKEDIDVFISALKESIAKLAKMKR
ncbi:MAG: cysteine desulfurase [Ruminococcaceae bacterium]|nr:cysteine desulfurase [Oscillospiraceae bacterium]